MQPVHALHITNTSFVQKKQHLGKIAFLQRVRRED